MNIRQFLSDLRPAKRRTRSRHNAARRVSPCQLERLECRTMLAGDVTAQLVGGNAVIRGDAADNSVEILVENGNVVVRGADGTTINGGSTDFVLAAGSIPGHLNAALSHGHDSFVLNGVSIGGNVAISGGFGNNRLAVAESSVIVGNLAISGLHGVDTISVQDSTVNGSISVTTHQGNDLIILSSAETGQHFVVNAGRGNNDIVIDDSRIGLDTVIVTGNDHDEVAIRDSELVDDVRIVTNRGSDVVLFDSSTVGDKTVIATGTGTDHILFDGSTRFFDHTTVLGGRAPDFLQANAGVIFDGLRAGSIAGSIVDPNAISGRITDGTTGVFALARSAVASFGRELLLSVNLPSVSEGAGDGAATLTITRSGNNSAALEVSLTSSDQNRLALEQSTVTIPAGQNSVSVLLNPQENDVVNDTSIVTITASATDFADSTLDVEVTDNDGATLTVAFTEAQVVEDSGNDFTVGAPNAFSFTVTRSGVTTQALTVELTTSAANFITVPDTITIPAGQNSAVFDGSTIADSVAEPDTTVVLTASAPGFQSGSGAILVQDNDEPRLIVDFSAPEITESGSDSSATATITRNTDTTAALSVTVTTQNADSLTFAGASSATLEIPAGQSSVTVTVNGVEELFADGDIPVAIVATAAGLQNGSALINALDDDAPALSVSLLTDNLVAEDAGTDSVTARITRNTTDNSAALTVTLTISDTDRLTGPATAEIPAGLDHVDVPFSPVNDNIVNQPVNGIVTITADAPGFAAGTRVLTVTNDDAGTISLSPTSFTVQENAGAATMTISRTATATAETIDLTYSNSDLLTGPATISFDAGQDTQSIPLTIVDNDQFAANGSVTVSAGSANHASVFSTILVENDEALTLTTNGASNNATESVGARITNAETYRIEGVTAPGAIIQADNDGDATFDDASVTADTNGNYSIDVPLVHDAVNRGANEIQLRALPPTGEDFSTLSTVMNIHRAIGSVVRFETNQDLDDDGNLDFYDVEMLDSDAADTVDNFLSYTTTTATGVERFDNLIVQRSDDDFVIQAGRYNIDGQTITEVDRDADHNGIPDTITNQFNAANSNVRGTLSMALPSMQPDGGSSEWFINTSDNTFLDSARHTVFGRVIGNGMDVVDTINGLPVFNLSQPLNQGALGELPLVNSPFTQLTGTVSLSANSSTVTGSGTLFTSEIDVNSFVRLGGTVVQVTSITSDTEMTIDIQATNPVTELTLEGFTTPQNSDFVVFTNIGKILDAI